MGNEIPSRARELVKRRTMGRCIRCGGPGSEWHHRRTRSVRDGHRHCPCNGVWLCLTDHQWVHAHPFEAKAEGLIVSKYEAEPGLIPVSAHFGELMLECNGKFNYDTDDLLERVKVSMAELEDR